MRHTFALILAGLCAQAAWCADSSASVTSKVLDGQLSMTEREVVSLAEAMPADKYSFAPTHGEFQGVRTFGQQVSHIAAVINVTAASVLGEKAPDPGKGENGPASLRTKEDIVKYLKEAFAYGHKAMRSITDQNATQMVRSAFGNGQVPRLNMATVPVWHSFDHYGQMVVYARMNGIVPPASRR
ncbi:MAG TPA: DinB family protein [Bryobacteraceae bacterium]|nr:DinB family protein [Bryobacteraceae bacterium]